MVRHNKATPLQLRSLNFPVIASVTGMILLAVLHYLRGYYVMTLGYRIKNQNE